MGGFCLDHRHLRKLQFIVSIIYIAQKQRIDNVENLPQTVNEIFLYSTVSTLKPIVGIVVTISPARNSFFLDFE